MSNPKKNPAAVALGRRGGKIGGKATSAAKRAAARLNGAKRKRSLLPCHRCRRQTLERDNSRRPSCGCIKEP